MSRPRRIQKKTPELLKAIQIANPGKQIEVWFQDEARVGQQGTLARIRAETGSRPVAIRDCGFKSAYIFGAICPTAQKASAMIFNRIGAVEMNIHLNEISKTISDNVHAVIIMDRAPWHKSVVIPNNMSIIYLPSYSPELNPVEQVWDFIRSNYLSNRAYKTLEDIFDACCNAWNFFAIQTELIKSIGTRSWINYD